MESSDTYISCFGSSVLLMPVFKERVTALVGRYLYDFGRGL